MKKIFTSLFLVLPILCWADGEPVEIESAQSNFEPKAGVWYQLIGNDIYEQNSDPGPAELYNGMAWDLANEFVFRTNLKNIYSLPARTSGFAKENNPEKKHIFIVEYESKKEGTRLKILVDLQDLKSKKLQIIPNQ
ncbi:hypothetical protein JXQ70_08075 [bacterium]|nr:hypothetical protein [bacterium]